VGAEAATWHQLFKNILEHATKLALAGFDRGWMARQPRDLTARASGGLMVEMTHLYLNLHQVWKGGKKGTNP
jgi:hypothetical protein